MHGVDERVGVDDLEALSHVYERALELYFSGPRSA
jgi:acetylornithine deacetylase/succinyl-diaminopimelate desuccinylase-like protein